MRLVPVFVDGKLRERGGDVIVKNRPFFPMQEVDYDNSLGTYKCEEILFMFYINALHVTNWCLNRSWILQISQLHLYNFKIETSKRQID